MKKSLKQNTQINETKKNKANAVVIVISQKKTHKNNNKKMHKQ